MEVALDKLVLDRVVIDLNYLNVATMILHSNKMPSTLLW